MAAPAPTTGIEVIDAELRRHAPFDSVEAGEALANRLLAVWRTLQPCSDGPDADRKRQRRR